MTAGHGTASVCPQRKYGKGVCAFGSAESVVTGEGELPQNAFLAVYTVKMYFAAVFVLGLLTVPCVFQNNRQTACRQWKIEYTGHIGRKDTVYDI